MRWLGSITDSMDMNLNKVWEPAEDRGAWSAAVYGVSKSGTWFSNWTTAITSPAGPQWFRDVTVGVGRWDTPLERNPWGSCTDTWRMTCVVTRMSVIRVTVVGGIWPSLFVWSLGLCSCITCACVQDPENCLCPPKMWFQGHLGPYVLETIIWFIKTTH